jgi:putative NADH-flavin reductase
VFNIVEKSSKYLLEIITLVSLVNKMGSDKVFVVGGTSFIYIKKSKGPKIYCWKTPCFTVPHFEENFSKDFMSVFYFLFIR